MQPTIYELLDYFLIYAFLGWCLEVVYATVVKGVFVNRGFLNGPICPIYGLGAIIVIMALSPLKNNVFILFIGSVILTSMLEYDTGYILEKVFHEKWWDYSEAPFNLHGYVCLKFSLLWGVACVFVIDIIHPMISGVVNLVPNIAEIIFLCVSFTAFAVDIGLTVATILRLKKHIAKIEELEKGLRMLSDGIGERISGSVLTAMKKTPDIEENIEELQARYKRLIEQTKESRLLKAFPNLAKFKKTEPLDRIKGMLIALKEKYEKIVK